jgi:hypothetical protein
MIHFIACNNETIIVLNKMSLEGGVGKVPRIFLMDPSLGDGKNGASVQNFNIYILRVREKKKFYFGINKFAYSTKGF